VDMFLKRSAWYWLHAKRGLAKLEMHALINPLNIVRDVVVIGASAGVHSAVIEILSRLPEDLPAFLGVVIHRGATSKSNWSHSLGSKTKLKVVEPTSGDLLARGVVYIAPDDCHMTFDSGRVSLDRGVKEHFTRPAVDPLFVSAAHAYGPRVVAVVLTGGGHDGTPGLLHVANAGGLCLVQKPSEARYPSMPEYAIARAHVCAALTVDKIGDALVLLTRGSAVAIADEDIPHRRIPPFGVD
jgi:two-component system, chemotaxis family, protein-glutamate methylesterase/glutaminase